MTNYILQSEDFSQAFNLSQINQLPAGNYNVSENGRIKHHHHVIIPEQENELYYLTAFDRVHDDELLEALESVSNVDVYKRSVERHESTFSKYVK